MTVRRWHSPHLLFLPTHALSVHGRSLERTKKRSRQERFAAALVQHVLQKYEDWIHIMSHAHESCAVSHQELIKIPT